jgi:hypothetical protein
MYGGKTQRERPIRCRLGDFEGLWVEDPVGANKYAAALRAKSGGAKPN